ncbi:MAG: hypothetical protein NXH82_08995 [Rhodobacteraceae bacterium]|nr:hypothetical protein [Paracoccaceae bacterium]
MAETPAPRQTFNIAIVAQNGRLQYEALLFAASLRRAAPGFPGRLCIMTPRPGPLWSDDPTPDDTDVLDALRDMGADIIGFENRAFGQSYPHGNKIEALAHLPAGEPFVFFDSDTLITDNPMRVPFDFNRPAASLRREDTWPKPRPQGPDRAAIWAALYRRFDLDFASSLDPAHPPDDWRHYLYFNAGFFFYRCPRIFGALFLRHCLAIRDDPPAELAGQTLAPWLDQVALPLTVHALGGGRDALAPGWLDGQTSCHYRHFPLLYARESDAVVALLETLCAPRAMRQILARHAPIRLMVLEGGGARARALFDRQNLPGTEAAIRKRLRAAGLWMR